MPLLQWSTLQPQDNSNIAAVLFKQAVKVSSIRIFPNGTLPFAECTDIVASTEPDAFVIDVFFTVSPIPNSVAAAGSGPKNALTPTRMVYTGSPTDYEVDMGPDHATRLIVFQGDFVNLSIAIYGEIVSEKVEVGDYEPRLPPTSEPISLSKSLDSAASNHPASLAEQLLSLLPNPPPLSLVRRLMFCLKPTDEDWEDQDFPYLYSDLDKEDQDFDLESLVQATSRPIRDDVSEESLINFASRVSDFIGTKTSDELYYVAKLLSITAPQSSTISKVLLQQSDIFSVLDWDNVDESTILCLFDAAANIEIARHFWENEGFMKNLQQTAESSNTDEAKLSAANRLLTRMDGWKAFERAFTERTPDYSAIMAFLLDMSAEEFSVGCWLECMLNLNIFTDVLHDESVKPVADRPVRLLQGEECSDFSDFVGFVRTMVAVNCILTVIAWADSTEQEGCRERALGILALWQGLDGYREIVNHCLLLRQLTRRLDWISKEKNPPKKSCMLAERILVVMARDPSTMLRDDFSKAVLSLEAPFSYIETDEFLTMKKLAHVSRDGLPSAIEELTFSSIRPFSLRRLRVLRVALAVITKELDKEDGDWIALQAFWDHSSQGLLPALVSLLVDVADDLNRHFIIQPIPEMNQSLSDNLFSTASDILSLIQHFVKSYPLSSRELRRLIISLADIFVCGEAATSTFSSSSCHFAASRIRTVCSALLHQLTGPDVGADPGIPAALVVLRTLLEHAPHAEDGRDPVKHISQIYVLIDGLLVLSGDQTSTSPWVASCFPKILQELKGFFRVLDPLTKTQLITRLFQLDQGESGIAEWLIMEELRPLSHILGTLAELMDHETYQVVLQYQAASIIALCDALVRSLEVSHWFVNSLSSNPELFSLLDVSLSSLLDGYYAAGPLTRLIQALAKYADRFGPDVRFNILLSLLRIAETDPFDDDSLQDVPDILQSLPGASIMGEFLRNEIGRLLASSSKYLSSTPIKPTKAEKLLQILTKLSEHENTKLACLVGISAEIFIQLCAAIQSVLPPERASAVHEVRERLTIDDDQVFNQSTTVLPSTTRFSIPLGDIESLLFSTTPGVAGMITPSTPKGSKTPDILGPIISPPTAVLRSPAATGLTKTYQNNDFRQLRQTSSLTRLNTSRMPSTHVDAFEHSSPEPGALVPVPMVVDVGVAAAAFQVQGLPDSL